MKSSKLWWCFVWLTLFVKDARLAAHLVTAATAITIIALAAAIVYTTNQLVTP